MQSTLPTIVSQKYLNLLVLLLCLQACAGGRVLEQWPKDIPQQSYFRQVYAADEDNRGRQSEQEYLTWVARFYQGWELMPFGWEDITDSVLVDLPSREHRGLERRMRRLGAQISAEWAKDNGVRLIDSGMLGLWAEVMQAEYSPDYRQVAVDLIARDVGQLLNGVLTREYVDEQRYSELLGISLEP